MRVKWFTLFARRESFGMRITIGARFSVDKGLPPFVASVVVDTIVGFVKDEDIVFVFPFCPLTRKEKHWYYENKYKNFSV